MQPQIVEIGLGLYRCTAEVQDQQRLRLLSSSHFSAVPRVHSWSTFARTGRQAYTVHTIATALLMCPAVGLCRALRDTSVAVLQHAYGAVIC